jgi:hypothetical protein
MIITPSVGWNAVKPVDIVNTANSYSLSNTSSYTYSGVSLGTADVKRYIVVAAYQSGSTTTRTISSVSVAGIGATQVVQSPSTTGASSISGSCGIWIAAVPSGTSGDVVLNLTTGASNSGISVYALYNLKSSSPSYSGTVSGNSLSGSMLAKGGGIGVTFSWVGSPSHTWSGLTSESIDVVVENGVAFSSAYGEFATASTLTTTATRSAGTSQVIAAAYFR